MKNKDPVFWAAGRLHPILNPRPADSTAVSQYEQLLADQRRLETIWRGWQLAQSRHWSATAERLRHSLTEQARRVQKAAAALAGYEPPRLGPTLHDLVAELRQLPHEFSEVEIQPRHKRICARTPPVTLEGIYLGPFSIQLRLDRLGDEPDSSAFEVIAIDPNPASGSEDVTHPHVKDNTLCAGDATVPIAQALAQGRITDAFSLVNAVLQTYNPASPYVDLQDWEGIACPDCGRSVRSDDRSYCEQCGSDYCASCISVCQACETSVCFACLGEDRQGRQLCRQCLRTCRCCGSTHHPARLLGQDMLCDACLATEQGETNDATEEEQPTIQPQTEESHESCIDESGPDCADPAEDPSGEGIAAPIQTASEGAAMLAATAS